MNCFPFDSIYYLHCHSIQPLQKNLHPLPRWRIVTSFIILDIWSRIRRRFLFIQQSYHPYNQCFLSFNGKTSINNLGSRAKELWLQSAMELLQTIESPFPYRSDNKDNKTKSKHHSQQTIIKQQLTLVQKLESTHSQWTLKYLKRNDSKYTALPCS